MQQLSRQLAHKSKIIAYLVLLISSLLYGGNIIAGKLIANDVPPAGLSALRGTLGLLIILPLAWPQVKTSIKPNKKEISQLIALGFFGISFPYITLIIGVKYSSGTNASIISATLPALTNTLLVLCNKVTLTKVQISGLLTSFIGLLIVFTHASLQHLFTLNLGFGDLVLLLNILSMAIFNVLGQSILQKLSSVVTCVYSLVFGTILLLPVGIWQSASFPWHLNLSEVLIIIYMGCLVTGLAFFLNLYGIILIGSSRASIFSYLQPVFGIFLSVLILGESLAIYHWIGFLLVIFGILLSLGNIGITRKTPLLSK